MNKKNKYTDAVKQALFQYYGMIQATDQLWDQTALAVCIQTITIFTRKKNPHPGDLPATGAEMVN
ncbi:MAG: hypothetical protein BV459_09170 [Thermoplasmata archaeon M11B2D]|nr:MAG: hypothetical protein BV459_09170 [Thermoplasmata archaeon M11B2D]